MVEDVKQMTNGNDKLTKKGRLLFALVGIVLMVLGAFATKPFFLSLPILLDPILLGIDITGSVSMMDGIVQGFDILYDLITGVLIPAYTPLVWVVALAGILAIQIGLSCLLIAINGNSPIKNQ